MPAGVLINIAVKGSKAVGSEFKKLGAKIKSLKKPLSDLGAKAKKASAGLNKLQNNAKKTGSGLNKLGKDANKASFGMFHMVKRSIGLVAVLGLVFKAVQLVTDGFTKAFNSIEKYAKQVAGLTALTITFMKIKPGEGLGEQYLRAKDYARGLYTVIEDIAAQTLLTGQQATLMARTFLENGVAINFQNEEQVQGLKSIANALAIVTEGQAKERQIRSEINNLLKGQIRPTEALGTLLKNINPDIKDQLKIWKQNGELIERVSGLLKGFNATTKDIAVTWEAVSTTISTTADRVLRGAFQPVYKDILDMTFKLNKWLSDNKDIIQIEMLNAYKNIKNVLSVIVDAWTASSKVILEVLDVVKEIAFWVEEGGRSLFEWVGKLKVNLPDGGESTFKEVWLEGAAALGITTGKAKELREEWNNFISEARTNRLTLQLTREGLGFNEIEEGLKNLPETLKESLNPQEIKSLIEEGFTSGLIPAFEAVDVMAKRIVVGKERLDELGQSAKKVGVEFNTIQLTRIIRDIPELEKVSAKTFEKMAEGIREIATGAGGKFVLLPDFAKILIPEFNKIANEADKALEKLFARVKAKMAKFALEASGVGLRGDDKEEFAISKKFDRMILARKSFHDKEKAILAEKNPELLAELEKQLKAETDKIKTEKEFQLNIYRNFTKEIKALQSQAGILSGTAGNLQKQQQLNKHFRDEAKFRQTSINLTKLEHKIKVNNINLSIKQAEQKLKQQKIDEDTFVPIMDNLTTQKTLEEELYAIQLRRTELLSTAMGSFQVGLEDTLNSYRTYSEQMVALGEATASSLQGAFRELFFDFMSGELKTAEEYWKAFATGIMGTLADNLSQLIVKFIMLGVAKLFAKDNTNEEAGKLAAETAQVAILTKAYIALGVAKMFAGAGGGAGASAGGAAGSVKHDGGLVMHGGGMVGEAPRFHSGGLNSDERIAILQTKERVLSRDQDKIFASMVSTLTDLKDARSESGVNVVNVYDESVVGRYASGGRGRKVIKNVLRG